MASASEPPPPPAAQADVEAIPYYVRAGSPKGPLDRERLADAYILGRVTASTIIVWEGAPGAMPLGQSPRFPELDRWYARNGSKVIGPLDTATLRAQLDDIRASGQTVNHLEVRLEGSSWYPLVAAVPLASRRPASPPAAPISATTRPPSDEQERLPRQDDEARQKSTNRRSIVTLTPRIGLALPGEATPTEVDRTRLGVGFPFHFDVVAALAPNFEFGAYFHYSLRAITGRKDHDTHGQRAHLVSGGAVAKLRLEVSPRSRLRVGMLVGANRVSEDYRDGTFSGKIVGVGLNVSPSLEWSIDVAPKVAANVGFAMITQVWGHADIGPLGAVVENGSQQDLKFPPLAFFTAGIDLCLGERRAR